MRKLEALSDFNHNETCGDRYDGTTRFRESGFGRGHWVTACGDL